MNDNFMDDSAHCGNQASLVSYLYDECEPDERAVIAAHVASCAACAAEIQALGDTRRMLPAWTPPEAALGFRITTGDAAPVLRPARWWQRPLPAWAQAAAAVLIFGAGLLAGGARDVSTRPLGTIAGEPQATPRQASAGEPAPTRDVAATPIASVSQEDLAALERDLRAELARISRAQRAAAASSDIVAARFDAGGPGTPVTRDEVEAMIADSESRQRAELILATGEVIAHVDARQQRALTPVKAAVAGLEREWEINRGSMTALVNAVSSPGRFVTVGTGR